MKFSETEGTDISNSNHKLTGGLCLFLMMFIGAIQTSFANNLNLYTHQDSVLAITNLGGEDNLFFNGILTEGILEAIQTDQVNVQHKSNSDGTGGKSNSDGTGKSNSDGTGQPESILTVFTECSKDGANLAYGVIEADNGTTVVEFKNVYLDGELMACNSKTWFADNS